MQRTENSFDYLDLFRIWDFEFRISHKIYWVISMRAMMLACFLVLLAGCVNQRTVFVNDRGERLTCEASGFGLAGSIMADNRYDECVSNAKARGYRLEEQK
jgi:hypothetical protein